MEITDFCAAADYG